MKLSFKLEDKEDNKVCVPNVLEYSLSLCPKCARVFSPRCGHLTPFQTSYNVIRMNAKRTTSKIQKTLSVGYTFVINWLINIVNLIFVRSSD